MDEWIIRFVHRFECRQEYLQSAYRHSLNKTLKESLNKTLKEHFVQTPR